MAAYFVGVGLRLWVLFLEQPAAAAVLVRHQQASATGEHLPVKDSLPPVGNSVAFCANGF